MGEFSSPTPPPSLAAWSSTTACPASSDRVISADVAVAMLDGPDPSPAASVLNFFAVSLGWKLNLFLDLQKRARALFLFPITAWMACLQSGRVRRAPESGLEWVPESSWSSSLLSASCTLKCKVSTKNNDEPSLFFPNF